jgi:hypothetical protein
MDHVSENLTRLFDPEDAQANRTRPSVVWSADLLLDLTVIMAESNENGNMRNFYGEALSIIKQANSRFQDHRTTGHRAHPNQHVSVRKMDALYGQATRWGVPIFRHLFNRMRVPEHPGCGAHKELEPLNEQDTRTFEHTSGAAEGQWSCPDNEGDEKARKEHFKTHVPPAYENHFLRKMNPIICGNIALEAVLVFEEFGIGFANAYGAITAMAHLYNLLQKTNRLQGGWAPLEHVMKVHTKEIFLGQPPDEIGLMTKRLLLVSGFSADNVSALGKGNATKRDWTTFMKQNHSNRMTKSRKAWDLLFDDLTTVIRDTYSKKKPYRALYPLLSELLDKFQPESSEPIDKLKGGDQPSIQYLAGLRQFFPTVINKVLFDYAALTRTCLVLFQQMDRQVCEVMGMKPIDDNLFTSPSGISRSIIMEALTGAFRMPSAKRKALELDRSDHMLTIATQVVNEYIAGGANGVPNERRVFDEPLQPTLTHVKYSFGAYGHDDRHDIDGKPWDKRDELTKIFMYNNVDNGKLSAWRMQNWREERQRGYQDGTISGNITF